MLILNNLTKQGTCDSVVVVEGKVLILEITFNENAMLEVKNNVAGTTQNVHMAGIIDNGIQYTFQGYNNRIKVSNESKGVYRGVDRS